MRTDTVVTYLGLIGMLAVLIVISTVAIPPFIDAWKMAP